MAVPKNDEKSYDVNQQTGRFRRILPQFIATTVKNLHTIDFGFVVIMPMIVIASLSGHQNEQNRDEFLSVTPDQASWIGSIGYIAQVIGSLVSGSITDPLGRKRALILVNIPFAIGWLLLNQSSAVWQIFLGFTMLGLGSGLMESPTIIFLGEICEPSVRSILIAYSSMCVGVGISIGTILNASMPWRKVALAFLAVPVTSTIALCFMPETPHWLLSKNRPVDAEKSLRWLRGWTKKEAISREFCELQRHSERSKSCNSCIKRDLHCSHPPPTFAEKFAELKRKRTLKAFAILIPLSILLNFTGGISTRPFIVQIFQAYDCPISSDKNLVILGMIGNFSQVTFMTLVRFTGKRRLYLSMAFGIFCSSLVIACYGFIYLPSGYNSFDQNKNRTFHLENPNLAYIPTICLYVWNFCVSCGFISTFWLLLSEIFSMKSRGLASGIACSFNYALSFITKKTYYNLETALSLPGVSLLYCVVCGIGLIVVYLIFPETDGRSLADIELHFSDRSKKITDRKIAKSTADGKPTASEAAEASESLLLGEK